MRVTDGYTFDSANRAISAARERHEKAIEKSTTGLKVQHPWDNPGAAGLITSHKMDEQRQSAINESVGRASNELAFVDDALSQMGSLVTRAQELAVQLSNDTYSPEQRAAAAPEVDGLLRSIIALGNTQAAGRYVFGGNLDNAPPFDATGNYVGDTAVRQVEIAPGILQDTSVRADVVLKGVGGGTDVLATLTALSTALSTNDVTGIRATLTGFSDGVAQISSGRARGGGAMAVLDAAATASRSARDTATENIANLSEADIFESASELALSEKALDAALTASAKSFRLSLLDKLG